MTGKAGHVFVTMRQQLVIRRHVTPGRIVSAHRLRIARLHTIILRVRRIRIYRVGSLLNAPPAPRYDHRILNNVSGLQSNFVSVLVFLFPVASDGLKQQHPSAFGIAKTNRREIAHYPLIELVVFNAQAGREPRRYQRCFLSNRSMTVDTTNLNRRARFVVKHSVAMRVLAKVTINAVHPFFEMNVVEMNGLSEAIRIVGRDDVVLCVKQIPFPIALEDQTEHPAVSMEIRKLRALQLRIEFRRARAVQEFRL